MAVNQPAQPQNGNPAAASIFAKQPSQPQQSAPAQPQRFSNQPAPAAANHQAQTVTRAYQVEFSGQIILNGIEVLQTANLAFAKGFNPEAKVVEVCKTVANSSQFNIVLRSPECNQGWNRIYNWLRPPAFGPSSRKRNPGLSKTRLVLMATAAIVILALVTNI